MFRLVRFACFNASTTCDECAEFHVLVTADIHRLVGGALELIQDGLPQQVNIDHIVPNIIILLPVDGDDHFFLRKRF